MIIFLQIRGSQSRVRVGEALPLTIKGIKKKSCLSRIRDDYERWLV